MNSQISFRPIISATILSLLNRKALCKHLKSDMNLIVLSQFNFLDISTKKDGKVSHFPSDWRHFAPTRKINCRLILIQSFWWFRRSFSAYLAASQIFPYHEFW